MRFGVKVKECAGGEKTSKHVRERNETPQREGGNKKKYRKKNTKIFEMMNFLVGVGWFR